MIRRYERLEPGLYHAGLSAEDLDSFADFSCGEDKWDCDLNDFLKHNALEQQTARFNKTYVFYSYDQEQSLRPVAFVALSTSEVLKEGGRGLPSLLRRAPYPSIPALLIGRLAVHEREQGKGFGLEIMAWIRNMALSLPVGCRFLALHVDQKNEAAIRFYCRHRFVEVPGVNVGPGMQLMLYDLVESQEAADEETNDPA